ncbi:hypothetical protein [Ideonella paludis]|uniref:hypothetical protein n=1 Tax=Ideonella paludis TaxID=1233411 RepID=UPI003630ECEA
MSKHGLSNRQIRRANGPKRSGTDSTQDSPFRPTGRTAHYEACGNIGSSASDGT